jgi:16S rRNA A1518/A1519 N6-dimethyltransferase RsmA/KsgA/DIM1 with predicted DNA glycosylase/AP lyase activity
MDLRRRATFDEIADLYDEVRPGYPKALVRDVIALSAIPPGGRILEIGCGPGKATLPFARRGYAMVCLELGERLAALASRHCRPYPRVKVIHTAFEEWPVEERASTGSRRR